MRTVLLTSCLLIGSAGYAQTQNSTTNCNVYGSTLNCNTTTQSQAGIDWNAYNQRQQQINQQNQDNINHSCRAWEPPSRLTGSANVRGGRPRLRKLLSKPEPPQCKPNTRHRKHARMR